MLESGCLLQSDVALRPENDWTRADVVEGAGELWGFPTLFQGQTVFKVMLRSYLPFYFRSVKSVQWNFSRLRDCMTVAVISECLQEQVRSGRLLLRITFKGFAKISNSTSLLTIFFK